MADQIERRQQERLGCTINRLLLGSLQVDDGEPNNCFFYLVDMSESGLRMNLDRPFGALQRARLSIPVATLGLEGESGDLSLTLEPRWEKCMAGGTWAIGMRFVDPDADTVALLKRILANFSPFGRRARFRLRQLLPMGIKRTVDTEWLNATMLDISPDGLQTRAPRVLHATKQEVDVNLVLDGENIRSRASIRWQNEPSETSCLMGLQFVDMHESTARLIQDYIDRTLGMDKNAARPQ